MQRCEEDVEYEATIKQIFQVRTTMKYSRNSVYKCIISSPLFIALQTQADF
jgi:hypothetical protein